jgi:hypothetical protein
MKRWVLLEQDEFPVCIFSRIVVTALAFVSPDLCVFPE